MMRAIATHAKLATQTGQEQYPTRLVAAWAVFLFFLASIASVVDRKIISLLVGPIKAELAISDVQIGLLQGFAFAICYALAGLPLGLAADRYQRKWLIIGGVAVWSAATLLSGFMSSFIGLFVCRLFVGIGEAALSPSVVSMISDLAPRERRGKLIGVFLMGQAIANGLSLMAVGFLLAAVPTGFGGLLPAVSHVPPWRMAFIACGAFGLVVVMLLLTLREPRRMSAARARQSRSVRETAAFFVRNLGVLAPFYLGFAAMSIAVYGLTAWSPTLLIRQFGMTATEVGVLLGPLIVVFSIIGSISGGAISDWASKHGPNGRLRLMPFAGLVLIPGGIAAFVPDPLTATVLVAISTGTFSVVGTLHVSTLQDLMPTEVQGTGTALMTFFGTLVGFSVGPLVIALGSTALSSDGNLIGLSISGVMLPILALGSACYILAILAYRRRGICSDLAGMALSPAP